MNKLLIFRIIAVILLCSLCFFGAGVGYIFLLKSLDSHSGVRVGRSFNTKEIIEYLFSLFSLAILPLFLLCLWKFTPVYSVKRKIFSGLIVLGCLSLTISWRIAFVIRHAQLRRQQLVEETANYYRFPPPLVHVGELNLWLYVIAALLVSTGLVYLLLRERKDEVIAFSFEQNG